MNKQQATPCRVLMVAACAGLLSGVVGQVPGMSADTFERPNESEECGAEAVDFLAYGAGLGLECDAEQCEYKEQAGTLFDIKYRQEYKVIEYKSSPELELKQFEPGTVTTYILHRCGTEQPDDEYVMDLVAADTSTIHFVEIPLTAVATGDSTVGWMLEELDLMDRVRFGSTTGTSPCVQLLAASEDEGGCGRPFIGDYSGADPTEPTEFDAEFGFTSDVEAKKMWMQASADPSPLARAEHIIYVSAFFNAEAKAFEYYMVVAESYEAKAADVPEDEDAPTVAWISTYTDGSTSFIMKEDGTAIGEGPAVKFSFARYKALLTRDAGGALLSQAGTLNTGAFGNGDDINFAASEFDSEEEMLEALQEVLEGVDVLIDETFMFTTVEDLLTLMGLDGTDVEPTLYPFIANDDIWRHDKAQTPTGNDDWFGGAVARPDLVHSDLKEIFTPGSVPNHEFRFFRNVAKGEEVTMVGPEECENLACSAWAQQDAISIAVDSTAAAPLTTPQSPTTPTPPSPDLTDPDAGDDGVPLQDLCSQDSSLPGCDDSSRSGGGLSTTAVIAIAACAAVAVVAAASLAAVCFLKRAKPNRDAAMLYQNTEQQQFEPVHRSQGPPYDPKNPAAGHYLGLPGYPNHPAAQFPVHAPKAYSGAVEPFTAGEIHGRFPGAVSSNESAAFLQMPPAHGTSMDSASGSSMHRKQSMHAVQATVSSVRSGSNRRTRNVYDQVITKDSLAGTVIGQTLRPGALRTNANADERQDHLNDQLDSLISKEVLGGLIVRPGLQNRLNGGQAVVQIVEERASQQEFAIKLFMSRAAFELERRLYLDGGQPLGKFLPKLRMVVDSSDGTFVDAANNPMPPCIVMEKGEALDVWVRRGESGIDMVTAVQVMTHIAARLKDLHAAGYVHRDLKPGNIMWLPRQNRWTLIDFGCAAQDGEQASLGFSVAYAAPEVIRAYRAGAKSMVVSPALDAWSLGVVAIELFTGLPAFAPFTPSDEVMEMIMGDKQAPWEDPAKSEKILSKLGFFRKAVMPLLQRDPSLRPSVADTERSCRAILSDTPTHTVQ